MKLSLITGVSLVSFLIGTVSAQAFELTCTRDLRAVDGGLTKVQLTIPNASGAGSVATIYSEFLGRNGHSADTQTLRDLTCTKTNHRFLTINCKGTNTFSVNEVESTGLPGHGNGHVFMVNTSYKNLSYQFGGSSSAPATVSTCEFHE